MAAKHTQNVSLTPELQRLIGEAIASGYYRSASEVVRAALRTFFDTTPRTPAPGDGRLFHEPRRLSVPSMDERTAELQPVSVPSESGPETSADRYRVLFEQAAVGIAHASLDGRWLMVNQGLCDILGYAREELEGASFQAFTHPDDLAEDLSLARALDAGEIPSFRREKRYLRKDGSTIWVEVTLSLIRDGSGAPSHRVALIQTIQDRKIAEEALRDSEERFRLLAASLPGFLWVAHADGNIRYINDRWSLYSGQSAADALPGGWLKGIHPEDAERVHRTWTEACAQGLAYEAEMRLRRLDGSYRWHVARAEAWRDSGGEIRAWFGTTVDIHDRKGAEEALRESESRLRLAIEAGRMAAWDYESATDSIRATPELKRLWGYPEDAELDVAEVRSRYYPGDRERLVAAAMEALQRGERFFEVEYRFYRADGALRWFLMRAEMLSLKPGEPPARTVGVLLDITDRKEAEEALREREANLNAALQAGSLAIFDFDLIQGELRPSPGLAPLYGYPPDHPLTIAEVRARYHPDDVEAIGIRSRTNQADRSLQNFDWTLRILLPGGEIRWVNGRGEYLRDETGRPVRTRGVVLDVTERKRSEVTTARLAAIVSSTFDAVVSFAAEDGRILTWNRGAEALFGYSEEEALGAPVHLLVAPEHLTDLENRTGVFERAMRDGPVRVDTIRRRKDGTLVDVAITATRMVDADGHVLGVSAIFRDITERKRAEDHQRLLINELNHRVKNTLATVQSIATQTLRNASTTDEAHAALESRLIALSRAHDVLTRERWEAASLDEIVARAMDPYRVHREGRIQGAGPEVRLPPRMALAIAMALQELATNAVKYGALSNEKGQVGIRWSVEGDGPVPHLRFRWEESEGPPVVPPSRRGFGSRLIERSLAQDLGGTVALTFAPRGLVCTVDAPIAPHHDEDQLAA